MSEGLSHNQQGLVDFLRRHSHIKELTFQRLDAFKQDEALVNDTWNASSKATLHWDHLTLSDIGSITMPNLRRLTLNINRFHGDDAVFKNISQFIQQSSSQLEFFSCEGAYLHHDETLVLVKALGVTAALPTMLRELHICTKTITGVLLTQLHEICSHLESLAIRMTAGLFDSGFLTAPRQELPTGNAASWCNMKFIRPLSTAGPGEPPKLAYEEKLKGGRVVQNVSALDVRKHEAEWMSLDHLLALVQQHCSKCCPAHA